MFFANRLVSRMKLSRGASFIDRITLPHTNTHISHTQHALSFIYPTNPIVCERVASRRESACANIGCGALGSAPISVSEHFSPGCAVEGLVGRGSAARLHDHLHVTNPSPSSHILPLNAFPSPKRNVHGVASSVRAIRAQDWG